MITPDDLAKVIACNLPSPYALDDAWHQTDDGATFDLQHASESSAEECRALARAVLAAVSTN